MPREAPRPPWVGGFIWAKTPIGADWISVALQNDGADLMFPVKDHPSDKAAMAALHITVPDPLIAIGPGQTRERKEKWRRHIDLQLADDKSDRELFDRL